MGLVFELAPFGTFSVWDRQGNQALKERVMRMQSCEEGIEVLKKARNACSSQLDDGALTELDSAISGLETALEHCEAAEDAARLNFRTLQAIAVFVSISTNVRDWMTR